MKTECIKEGNYVTMLWSYSHERIMTENLHSSCYIKKKEKSATVSLIFQNKRSHVYDLKGYTFNKRQVSIMSDHHSCIFGEDM